MLLRLLASATALLLALACSPGGGSVPEPAPQGGDPAEQADGGDGDNAGGDDASVTLAADAEVNGTCRPQPRQRGDTTELVANVEIANTGDLGVKVRIAARWPQPQGKGIIRWKRVNVEQGETRELTLRLGIGDAEAKAVRAAVELDRTCSLSHRVIGAYGN